MGFTPEQEKEVKRIRKELKKLRAAIFPLSPEEQEIYERDRKATEAGLPGKTAEQRSTRLTAEQLGVLDEISDLFGALYPKRRVIYLQAERETEGKPIIRNWPFIEYSGRKEYYEEMGFFSEKPWFWEIEPSCSGQRQWMAKMLRGIFRSVLILTPEQYQQVKALDSLSDKVRRLFNRAQRLFLGPIPDGDEEGDDAIIFA
jgi:hypothetical protein